MADLEGLMSQSAKELLNALRELRQSITAEAARRIEQWHEQIELASFAASAENLAHYLAFRHHDLRALQRELMRHGLSSLGRDAEQGAERGRGGHRFLRPVAANDGAPVEEDRPAAGTAVVVVVASGAIRR